MPILTKPKFSLFNNIVIILILNLFTSALYSKKYPKKSVIAKADSAYTVGIYIAADNDLFPFAGRNIKQVQNVGSNEKLNIVVHFNMHKNNGKKISKRFLIKKDKLVQIGSEFYADSGNVNTLIDFCKWQIETFPAENHMLVLWNHGTGIIEPNLRKAINPSQLFNYNPKNKLIELNRNINFFDFISLQNSEDISIKQLCKEDQLYNQLYKLDQTENISRNRGICFDDTTRNYLTNKDLQNALEIICKKFLKGKKLAILACDACLMSMIEVVGPIKDYANYFVSSQEVVLGTGYDYTKTLEPLLNSFLTKAKFAEHIVKTYKDTYGRITNDYTQSAIDLSKVNLIEENLAQVVNQLLIGLEKQDKDSVKELIRLSKHKNNCTHFDEVSYIDLGHFYYNLLNNINKCVLKNTQESNSFKANLTMLLNKGIEILSNAVVASVSGKNLKNATGLSIYFPERNIHPSYNQSIFATKTNWISLLRSYIRN